jgi:predicted RNase H-like HicB family nuclease
LRFPRRLRHLSPFLHWKFDGLEAGFGFASFAALVSLQHIAQMKLTAVYMKVPEGHLAFVEELPGSNTQGKTLEEARANLKEAVTMVLDANRELSQESLEGAEVIREALTLPLV